MVRTSLPIVTGLGPLRDRDGRPNVLPQSVNIDFQTGIAEGTLLLASVRWAEWTETAINTQSALGTIDYDNDVFTYSLGVARRLSDDFAVLGRVTYEDAKGGLASNLAPTDGSLGLSLAGIYDVGNARITAGVNYTWLGDATTENHRCGMFSRQTRALGSLVRPGRFSRSLIRALFGKRKPPRHPRRGRNAVVSRLPPQSARNSLFRAVAVSFDDMPASWAYAWPPQLVDHAPAR